MVNLTIEQHDCPDISVTILIAVLVLTLIIIAINCWLVKRYRKSEKFQLKKKAQNEGRIDFNDILQTAFSRKDVEELRRKLLAKCHPDRFIDQLEKAKKAEGFYKKVNKASTSLTELVELENKINKEL